MKTVFLNNIYIEVSVEEVFKSLKADQEDEYAVEIMDLYQQSKIIARPKALYGLAYIDDRGDDWVKIERVRFDSRLLSMNLKEVHRIFPYIITCGRELHDWAKSITDPIKRIWADSICELYLRKAISYVNNDFNIRMKLGKTASMNPGSLEDWPINQQQQLFTLLGNKNIRQMGIELTESFLIIPVKSISGIKFQTEKNFENCMLCPRERCPGRRALYMGTFA